MTTTHSVLYNKIYGTNADQYRFEGNSITDKYLLNGSVRQIVETFDFSKNLAPFNGTTYVVLGPYLEAPFVILDVIAWIITPSTTVSTLTVGIYTANKTLNLHGLLGGIDLNDSSGYWSMTKLENEPYFSASEDRFIGVGTVTTTDCADGKLGIKIIYSKD